MANQRQIFTLKEVIKPVHTLTSFGYKTIISPDSNYIVVIDAENSFISFYNRDTLNTNSPFSLANRFSKPEFRHQYILTNPVFNQGASQCYLGVKYCDYVNYDTDIRRDSFLASGIIYIRQSTRVPKFLENTVIYEEKSIWSQFFTLPYVDPDGYELLHVSVDNKGLYALTKTSGVSIKLFYQPLDAVNTALYYNVSDMITIDPPVEIATIAYVRNIKFVQFDSQERKIDYILLIYSLFGSGNRNLFRRTLTPTNVSQDTLVCDNVYNFQTSGNFVVCDKMTSIEIYDVDNLTILRTYIPEMTDIHGILAMNSFNPKLLQISNASKQLIIYKDPYSPHGDNFYYNNTFGYTSACFDKFGNMLVLGQPKNGRVLIFHYLNGWSFFQELKLDGFSHRFDIDGEEKTLVITNQSERVTDIYENVSYDLTTLQTGTCEIPNIVNTINTRKYYETISIGYTNVILSNNDFNPSTIPKIGELYPIIPYYIPSDGNMILSIYESYINQRYHYHVYANDVSGHEIVPEPYFLFYSQSGIARLKSITSDRYGDTILLLREDNLTQLYKKVNLDAKQEIYVFINQSTYDFRDIWTTWEYNPLNDVGARIPIDNLLFNKRGNILIVVQGSNIVVLHYEQELIYKQIIIGHSKMGTTKSNDSLPEPKTEYGYDYKYFLNEYELLSKPIISYILDEIFIHIDDNDNIYTWKNNVVYVYSEDNFYLSNIQTIPFVVQNPLNISIFPDVNLFTYKDDNNIYFYYHDKLENSLINTNVTVPACEKHNVIDNHIIQYSNKNIKIDYYTLDVIQNDINLTLNTIHYFPINTLYNFGYFSMDYKNNINVLFKGSQMSKYYRYTPDSFGKTKYKHMITFREQKVDVNIQYKHDEFYNNVIQVLPTNYISNNISTSMNNIVENESQFKIYCSQKFTYGEEDMDTKLHTFTPDFNKKIYYSNEVVVSKYFDPKKYTTLNQVLKYMNGINDNRSISLFRITEKRYIGIIATMKGGEDSVAHKYTLLDKSKEVVLFRSPTYVQGVDEKISSNGIKFLANTYDPQSGKDGSEEYIGSVLPSVVGRTNGIYVYSDTSIDDDILIRYDVDRSLATSTTAKANYPKDIQVYLMTELTIDIVTEETIQNSSYLAKNDIEYGKFTNISKNGNLIVIGSNVDTLSNVKPSRDKKKTFNLYIEQTFIHSKADYTIGNGTSGDPRQDITYTINWNVDYKYKDEDKGIEDFISVKKYNTIPKLEELTNRINTYYGSKIITLKYKNYHALKAHNLGGLGGRRLWFAIDHQFMIITDDMTRWKYDSSLKSPKGTNVTFTGVNPLGSTLDDAYRESENTTRPSTLLYSVWYSGGTEAYADNINISYVSNISIEFTEEYLQRYHYNVIKYGCLFYYIRQRGKWRHLNSLYFKSSPHKPLRRSFSLTATFFPDHLEIINNKYIMISKNRTSMVIQNYILDDTESYLDPYYQKTPFEISINYKAIIPTKIKYIKGAEQTFETNYYSTKKFTYDRISVDLINNDFRNLKTDYSKNIKMDPDIFNDIHSFYLEFMDNVLNNLYQNQSYNIFITNNSNYITSFKLFTDIFNNGTNKHEEQKIEFVSPIDSYYKIYFGMDLTRTLQKMECSVVFSEFFARAYGIDEFTFKDDNILYLNKLPYYEIFQANPQRDIFGKHLNKCDNTQSNNPLILGSVNQFEVFENGLILKTKFSLRDKIGNLYVNENTLYNAIPEKGLVRKYILPPLQIDPQYKNFPTLEGSQVFQDYTYSGFGNTFCIFDNTYAVVGTKEGKVIIQHLTDKDAGKGIVDSGSSSYGNFGSVLRSGKFIYINAPELNKLYIVNNIPYYE